MNFGLTHSAYLKGSSQRNCFLSLPHHWQTFIAPVLLPTFKLEPDSGDRSLVVSWGGQTHEHDGEVLETIFVNLKLLKANRFSEGEAITVRQISCPPPCTSASMRTTSFTDWEHLLLNVELAEEAFLAQVRVVKKDQVIPLWLEGGACVYLKVDRLSHSSNVGILQFNSRVDILPPLENPAQQASLALNPPLNKKEAETYKEEKFKSISDIIKTLYAALVLLGYGNKKTFPKSEILVGLKPLPFLPPSCSPQNLVTKLLTMHPSLALVSSKILIGTKFESKAYFIGEIGNIHRRSNADMQDGISASLQETPEKVTCGVVLVWEKLKLLMSDNDLPLISEIDLMLRHKTCILSISLRNKLLLQENNNIFLKTSGTLLKNNSFHADVCMNNNSSVKDEILKSTIISIFQDICTYCPIVLNDSNIMRLPNDKTDVVLTTRDERPIFVDKNSVHLLSLNFESPKNSKNPKIMSFCIHDQRDTNKRSYAKRVVTNELVLETLLAKVQEDLNFGPLYLATCPQFIMLQGNKGAGKTTLVARLTERLSKCPYYVHCEIICLKLLKGKKVESVYKVLKEAFREAQQFQPSLIVLDDIDFIAPTHSEVDEQKGALFEHVRAMAFMIKTLLTNFLDKVKGNSESQSIHKKMYVSVVATCCSRNNVHSFLSSPKGSYIFPCTVQIGPLNKDERFAVLQILLEEMHMNFLKKVNVSGIHSKRIETNLFQYKENQVMPKLDGLTLTDVTNLALRVFLEAQSRWGEQHDRKTEVENHFIQMDERTTLFSYQSSDINNASREFISLSSRALNIPTTPKFTKRIGGMHKAREALEEMIFWPIRFPHLYSQSKLRPRSGILLYGPPGCGKTLLASSFQNDPHLNFITVKGPELLSKYIGQSEKSVRDAFERARNARPCVLFFDEFESIGPRRGHDNTGVTDRVVNQLLTQMDGVEGLEGVYVVATTSRPDLIDPALLRPGRLDKGILCPIPDENDREEILEVLSKEMNLDDIINFKEIARKTHGFSGADLQSILSTAQVIAAQEFLGCSLYEDVLDASQLLDPNNWTEDTVKVSAEKLNSNAILNQNRERRNGKEFAIGVSRKHLWRALDETQPSISLEDLLKYEALHKRFSRNESQRFVDVKPGQRETLA